jgi:hypothetical protein
VGRGGERERKKVENHLATRNRKQEAGRGKRRRKWKEGNGGLPDYRG